MATNTQSSIFGRRSVREYTGDSIDEAAIRRLIDAAIHAPNAVNEQPWTFTVVRDQSLLERISSRAKAHMLASMSGGGQSEHFRSVLEAPDFHIFYHAPALILISARVQGPWVVEDCALAAENLMLAAYAEGIGSCWIGFAQGFLNTTEGRKLLDLPEPWISIAPIVVGRPTSFPPPVPRKEAQIRWVG